VLRERSGLVVGPGIYSFAHKSIAEYLVAEAVLQGDQRDASGARIDRFYLFEHRVDDRWNTVTFLWAGLAPVADVEAFIQACIEATNWALAYGILSDQYDRVPIDARRQLLLQPMTAEQFPETLGYETWWNVSSHGIRCKTLEIPSFNLRGLGTHLDMSFFKTVLRATADGTIVWADQINAKGKWRDLLWMCFATRPDHIDEWKACLASPCPASASPREWLYWVVEHTIWEAMIYGKTDIKTALATYQGTCPQTRGLVPIALVSVGLGLLPEGRQPSQPICASVNKLLEVLPDSDKGDVIPEWLLGTRDWVLSGWNISDIHIGDLFAVFVTKMEELAEQGHIERNVTYECAIKFVRELQNRREALDASACSPT
jgi:hypothetical protein